MTYCNIKRIFDNNYAFGDKYKTFSDTTDLMLGLPTKEANTGEAVLPFRCCRSLLRAWLVKSFLRDSYTLKLYCAFKICWRQLVLWSHCSVGGSGSLIGHASTETWISETVGVEKKTTCVSVLANKIGTSSACWLKPQCSVEHQAAATPLQVFYMFLLCCAEAS